MDQACAPARIQAYGASTGQGRLDGLDLLRGIAALWVLSYHLELLPDLGKGFLARGYLAVDFFFMLSGYVMARTYEQRFAQGLGATRFMVLRYRRLWPIVAIGMAIGAPMLVVDIPDRGALATVIVCNALLLPVFMGYGTTFPLNGVVWSIFAELVVNTLHAAGVHRMPRSWPLTLAAAMVPVLLWANGRYGSLDVGAAPSTLWLGIARAVFGYTVGIVLWRKLRDQPLKFLPPAVACLAMPIAGVLFATPFLVGAPVDPLFVILVCPIVLAGALGYRGPGLPARLLGAMSFPLYAIHLPMIFWAKGLGIHAFAVAPLILLLSFYIALRTDRALSTALSASSFSLRRASM